MVEKKKKTNVLQVIMTLLLIVAAFAIGSMWTELRMLRGGVRQNPTVKEAVPGEENVPEEVTELSETQRQELLTGAAAARGSDDARVVLVEFTDYQCPFCKRHFDQTEAQIEEEYIETGKVKHVMRDLPLPFHENAYLAAEAARCAGDQERYLDYHDKLFEMQAVWGEGEASSLFKGYAGELGLNQGEFASCLDEGKHKEAVDDDLVLAAKVGATGTPSFFINGKSLIGAQPFISFKDMIDEALGE